MSTEDYMTPSSNNITARPPFVHEPGPRDLRYSGIERERPLNKVDILYGIKNC